MAFGSQCHARGGLNEYYDLQKAASRFLLQVESRGTGRVRVGCPRRLPPDSDVDLLVTFASDAQWSLYDWTDMIGELREIFGRDVDLLSPQALRNPFRRHEILKAREILYAA